MWSKKSLDKGLFWLLCLEQFQSTASVCLSLFYKATICWGFPLKTYWRNPAQSMVDVGKYLLYSNRSIFWSDFILNTHFVNLFDLFTLDLPKTKTKKQKTKKKQKKMPKQDIQNTVLCCQKTLSVGSFTRHPNNTACCKWSEENVFQWIFLKAVVSTQHCLLHVLQFLPLLKSQSDFPLPYIIQSCLKRTAQNGNHHRTKHLITLYNDRKTMSSCSC